MRWSILILGLLISKCNAQFGEIASLATSLLGGALGGGGGLGALAGAGAAGAGAAQAGGALAQIGQLYQLAQGALQLTGTGVGVLNQASEGNWFPAVLEQTAKNSQSLMKGHAGNGLNLGALGPVGGKPGAGNSIGPEFGTSFPAPNIDDYDENAEIPGLGKEKKTPTAPDGLIDIDSGDYETDKETTTTTTTEAVTLFPDNEEEEHTTEPDPTSPPPRQIRIQLPDKSGTKTGTEEDLDYEDLIHHKEKVEIVKPVPTIDAESTEELKKNVIATFGTKTQPIVPKLDKLVEVLQKSKLSQEEIEEIVAQVEGNKKQEKPPKFDFDSSVQNIPEKKNQIRQKITDASRVINANYANERKDQSVVIQQQIDDLKIVPDLAQGAHNSARPTHVTPVPFAPKHKAQIITTSPPNVQKPRVHETRSVPNAPAPAPTPAVTTVATTAPQAQVQPNAQQAVQQPNYNYLYPNQYPQQQQQYNQYYYNQAPYYGQQTQNYWGQQSQTYPQNNQYNQQQQQQLYYTTTPSALNYNQQYYQQYHQASQAVPQQQQQQGAQNQQHHAQQVQQPQVQQQQQQHQVQQPQVQLHLQQAQQGQQQQYYTQQPQTAAQQPTSYSTTQQQFPNKQQQPQPLLQQQYRQSQRAPSSQPAAQHVPNQNANNVYHYYHDGRQVVQQIIPKQIAANSNLPLNGPFRPQVASTSAGIKTDPAEYKKSQQALQQAYSLPQTRSSPTVVAQQAQLAPANTQLNVQQPVRAPQRVYESTVTATGNRQAHAIRTYQATKVVQPKVPNHRPPPTQSVTAKPSSSQKTPAKTRNTPQPPNAVRSSGRSAVVQKKLPEPRRISGHVLPGPVIDHRSLLEKRTTAKPRYVRMP